MNLLSSFSRCRVLQNNFSYLKCSTVGPCRFMSTKPVITDEQSKSFNKKLAMLQKKYGVKGTTKFLSLEREMWHLRHKETGAKESKRQIRKRKEAELLGVNKTFRAVPIRKNVIEYIDNNKLGRRRPEPKSKETRVMQHKKEYIPKLKFSGSAKKKSSFIAESSDMFEVAFVGRSNVGKSTLLNTMTSSGVARTSDTPGETRAINWYNWANRMYLVDLPGYGFSYSSMEAKQTWKELMQEYTTKRKTLKRVMILVDARHGIKASDLEMAEILNDAKKKFQIVLTKVDTVTPNDLARRFTVTQQEVKKYKHLVDPILMVSSKKSMGVDKLRNEVERFLRPLSEPKKSATETPDEPTPKKEISVKEKWKKDEQRRKEMIERKREEIEDTPEEDLEPIERDEKGKVFKPDQKFKRGKSPKGKKNVTKRKT